MNKCLILVNTDSGGSLTRLKELISYSSPQTPKEFIVYSYEPITCEKSTNRIIPKLFGSKSIFWFSIVSFLYILREEKIDTVVSWIVPNGMFVFLFARLTNLCRCITVFRGQELIQIRARKRALVSAIFLKMATLQCKLSHKVQTQTAEGKEQLINLNISPSKIIVLGNNANSVRNIKLLKRAKQVVFQPYLLYVGKLSLKTKGLDRILNYLIKYESYMRENDLIFVIVGSGPDKPSLLLDLEKYSLADLVVFTGDVENVFNYYCFCEAVLIPSRTDSFPNVIVEAVLASKPFLVSNLYNLRDIIAEENRVDFDNLDEVQNRLLKCSNIKHNYNEFYFNWSQVFMNEFL